MRHLAIFGDIFDDHNLGDGGLLLASSVISRDQRRLDILQGTGQPSEQRIFQPNMSVELTLNNPCLTHIQTDRVRKVNLR